MANTKTILRKDGRPKYMQLRIHRDGGIEVRAVVYRGTRKQFYRSYTIRSVEHVKSFFMRLIEDLVQCNQISLAQAKEMRSSAAYTAWYTYYGPIVENKH